MALEPGPHRYLRRVWEIQIVVIAIGGTLLAVARSMWLASVYWWLLGVPFALGIYVFERVIARALKSAVDP